MYVIYVYTAITYVFCESRSTLSDRDSCDHVIAELKIKNNPRCVVKRNP